MRRLGLIDKWLLGTLLPIWLICFTLHVRQVARTGLALPPVFAAPARGADDYPHVGGLRPGTFISDPGLQVGDRLLRVGDADLRGVGYIGFYAAALAQSGTHLSVPVEFERAGQRALIALPLSRAPLPWFRVPALLAIVFTCILVLLRAAPSSHARLFFAAFMSLVILETPFDGGPPIQTYASQLVFCLAGGITVSLMLRWALLFPEDVAASDRIAAAWAWPAGLLWYGLDANFVLGGPLPTPRLPAIALAADGLFGAAFLSALTWNYAHARPIGRRRIKWVLLGAYAGTLTLLSTVVVNLIDPQSARLDGMLMLSTLALPTMAMGFLIGIIRYNLFDIDRLISATTAYSIVLVALLAAGIIAAPTLAAAITTALDIEPVLVQIALAICLAVALVPAQRPVRRWVDRLFFKERVAFQEGITRLLRELSACEARSLLARAGEALDRLLRPHACIIYTRAGQEYAPVFVRGEQAWPSFGADSALAAALAQQSNPLVRERWTQRRGAPALSAFDRAALETLGADLVVPVHQRAGLSAFICLGGKRSGDAYTRAELTLLTIVGDKLASGLDRFNDAPPPLATRSAPRLAQELGQVLVDNERLENVILFALVQCREALAADSAAVLLLDTESQLLCFPYVADDDAEVAARLRALRFPADRGIAGAVLREGKPTRVDDVAADPRFFAGVDKHSGRRTRALLCVPLIAHDETLGVIEVVNPLGRPAFDDRDLELLEALAGGIASTIASLRHRSQEECGAVTAPPQDAEAAGTASEAADASIHQPPARFRKEGDFWSITYEGTTFRLKDTKGLHCLAHLLRHPGQEFHALDLMKQTGGKDQGPETGNHGPESGDQGPLLDAQAKAEYKRRVGELREELDEAERCNDVARAAQAREEIEFLTQELSAAVGLGGRDRKAGAHAERARLLVTQRIKATLSKIRAAHPALGHHLAGAVKTGYFCSYTPPPNHPMGWES